VILSHKIRLYPNNKAITYFKKACGIKRFTYNWALDESRRLYEGGIKTNKFDLRKRFTSIIDQEYSWIREVTKWAYEKAIYDLWDSWINWWKGITSSPPKYKKKGKCKESFYLGNNYFTVVNKKIRVSRLGWVRMAQEVRFPGKYKSVTISQSNNKWYASVAVELPGSYSYPHACDNQEVCGIDLGIRDLVVLNNGEKLPAPRELRRRERKLRKLQKSLSRKKRGSNSYKKAKTRLSELYRKIKDTRKDYTHKITSELVKKFRFIGIENLSIKGMIKNRSLAKSLQDAALREIRRQLEYKSQLSGSHTIIADRWFPSTKLCSDCNYKMNKIPLNVRSWTCPACGACHDRDINAAKNLASVALGYRDTLNAGGETVRPYILRNIGLDSMKPELSGPGIPGV